MSATLRSRGQEGKIERNIKVERTRVQATTIRSEMATQGWLLTSKPPPQSPEMCNVHALELLPVTARSTDKDLQTRESEIMGQLRVLSCHTLTEILPRAWKRTKIGF